MKKAVTRFLALLTLIVAGQRHVIVAICIDQPDARLPAIGHDVHKLAHVSDAIAIRRNLGERRPFKLEHILSLEHRAFRRHGGAAIGHEQTG